MELLDTQVSGEQRGSTGLHRMAACSEENGNGGRIGSSVYGRAWANAREDAFTEEVAASPLAKRPYDLRHACISTWLNAGVEAPRGAEWANDAHIPIDDPGGIENIGRIREGSTWGRKER